MRFLYLALVILSVTTAEAKRIAISEPITVSSQDHTFTTSTEECGILIIKSKSDPRKIKNKRVYRIWYNPFIEKDVQDIWIKDMFICDSKLWICDETDRIFTIEIKLFEVTRRSDLNSRQFNELKNKKIPPMLHN